jgi:hypothetical protein
MWHYIGVSIVSLAITLLRLRNAPEADYPD